MSRKVIGMDLGGTKLLGGVVDEQLEVHDRVHRLVEGLSEQALVEAIVETRDRAAGAPSRRAGDRVRHPVPDRPARRARGDVREPAARPTSRSATSCPSDSALPVFIDNDANVATLVEARFGAARGADHVVGLTIGTGIGGGLILDGKRLPREHAAPAPSWVTW